MCGFYQFFRTKAVFDRTILANVVVLTLLAFLFLIANHFKKTPPHMAASDKNDHLTKPRVIETFGKLPMAFEVNRGQADEPVKFLARGSGYTLFLSANEAVLALRKPVGREQPSVISDLLSISNQQRATSNQNPPSDNPTDAVANPQSTILRMKLVNTNPNPQITGADKLTGKTNYFIGNDPKQWRTDVPNYARVKYEEVYSGVDLVYYGNQRQLEYDFVVAPGADPEAITLGFEGANDLNIDDDGKLMLHLDDGEVTLHTPVIYQEINGSKQIISGNYVRRGKDQIGFQVAAYDVSSPLVIDPVLSYSTYLGGSSDDFGSGVAVDTSGNVYVTGATGSTNFPTLNPQQPTNAGGFDAFVTKLNRTGGLVYSTYLGGKPGMKVIKRNPPFPPDTLHFSGDDISSDIAVDVAGNAYLIGNTESLDFPRVNAIKDTLGGDTDAFVTKLNSTGSALVYSTYLGGNADEQGFGIATDTQDNAYVTGLTGSSDFPYINAIKDTLSGFRDAFVAKLNPTGRLAYSTYLGGGDLDEGHAIAVDAFGNAIVTGGTFSLDFPTVNALQPAQGGGICGYVGDIPFRCPDAFITKINSAGSSLVYSTYLGGSGAENLSLVGTSGIDFSDIAVDPSGNAYVTGFTASNDFPTLNPLQPFADSSDAFVTEVNPTGGIVYSTYLGGSSFDFGRGIAVDVNGNAYITGETFSTNFPAVDAIYPNFGGGLEDAFAAKINIVAKRLEYATYLGGSDLDGGLGIAVDDTGNAYVIGGTASTDFPTMNPTQSANAGSYDAFVAKIYSDQPLPIVYVWQEIPISHGSGDFSVDKKSNLVTFDNHPADVIEASTDLLIVRVPPDLIGDRSTANAWPDSTLREVPVVVRVIRAPGDTVVVSHTYVRFCPPRWLLYDHVTRAEPPLLQGILLGKGPRFRQAFIFLGPNPPLADEQQGTVGVRITNTSAVFPKPLKLLTLALSPPRPPVFPLGEFFGADANLNPTEGNLQNLGLSDAGLQFLVDLTGIYLIVVEAGESSFGPFPAQFQIHLAGNVGLPRKRVNGIPQPWRATRHDILFNHSAPRPEALVNNNPALGRFAETAVFKFANPVSTSQFAIAVLVPPTGNPLGFSFGIPPVRSAPPVRPGLLRTSPVPIIDPTVPTALSPGAVIPVPGTVVDYTQVPIPASPDATGPLAGALFNILWTNDGVGVTLPFPGVPAITSLIVDMGSGNEIVDGTGADFRVFGLGSGTYSVAVSSTPFDKTFVSAGSGSGQLDFDLSSTGLTSARYVRLAVAEGTPVIDAVQSLHFFVDSIHPTAGPLADVGFATITMRRQKSPVTPLDCLLELIGPDGSFLGKNESGFGDETSQDRSDAALIHVPLTQQGFHRYLGRGYDTQPDEQAFGNFFTRLETAGNYDKVKIQISPNSESQTNAQKHGLINTTRQRDSFLFETAPGTTLSIVVNGVTNPSPPLSDPLIELYDPEDFLIAANDNFPGRGKNAALTVTLPTIGRAGAAFPNPSTYRIVVMGIDGESRQETLPNGVAHLRSANDGNYELKVFTGPLTGTAAPAIVGVTPNIVVQGATNLEVTINGNNFANGARVAFSEAGITVKTVNFVNSNQLKATIDIAAIAPIGGRNVIVTNPDAQSGTGTGVFEVRQSLGTSALSWEAPAPGEGLPAPRNLRAQIAGGQAFAKTSTLFSPKIILGGVRRKQPILSTTGSLKHAEGSPQSNIDEIEPNNDPGQAQVLMGDSPLTVAGRAEVRDFGNILIEIDNDFDDVEDLFKVTTTASGLRINLDDFTSDCDLYLFDAEVNNVIGESIAFGATVPEEIDLPNLTAGTYIIGVTIYDPDPGGADSTAYALKVTGTFDGGETAILQSYNIYRSTSANARSTGARVGNVNSNATSFTDPMPHTGNFFYQVTAVYDRGESAPSNEASILVTRVDEKQPAAIPIGFDLRQSYPNPFNPETRIQFDVPKSSHVRIEIYNIHGQKIRSLVNEEKPAGACMVTWDGRMDNGELAASGVYFYRLVAGEFRQTRKMALLR